MKRSIVFVLALALVTVLSLSLFACGNDKEPTLDFANDSFTVEQAYAYAEELGFNGTLDEFVAMLSGKDGANGVGISTIAVSAEGHLVVTLTSGTVADLGVLPKGEKGDAGENGKDGAPGKDGKDGNGIESVEKTSSDGKTDTYTVTFTDGKTTTFTVTNGTNGTDGQDGKDGVDGAPGKDGKDGVDGKDGNGISSIEKTTEGSVDTYTITYTNGDTYIFTVTNGQDGADGAPGKDGKDGTNGVNGTDGKDGVDGAPGKDGKDGVNGKDGNGISSIEKTTEGSVDTYTITYTNGDTYIFTVTNGQDGADGAPGKDGTNGVNGKDGKDGEDGTTPTIGIDEDGYWVINGITTNVLARGTNGTDGQDGKDGIDGTSAEKEIAEVIELVVIDESGFEMRADGVAPAYFGNENTREYDLYAVVAYTDDTVARILIPAEDYEVTEITFNNHTESILKYTIGDKTYRLYLNGESEGGLSLMEGEMPYYSVLNGGASYLVLDLSGGRTVGEALADYYWTTDGDVFTKDRALSVNDFVGLGNWTLAEAETQGITLNAKVAFDVDWENITPTGEYYWNGGFILWDGTTDLELTDARCLATKVAVDGEGNVVAMFYTQTFFGGWWNWREGNGKVVVYSGALGENDFVGVYNTAESVEDGKAKGMIANDAEVYTVTGDPAVYYELDSLYNNVGWFPFNVESFPFYVDLSTQDARILFTVDGKILPGTTIQMIEGASYEIGGGETIDIMRRIFTAGNIYDLVDGLENVNFFEGEKEITFVYESEEFSFLVSVPSVALLKDADDDHCIRMWDEAFSDAELTLDTGFVEVDNYYEILGIIYDEIFDGAYYYRADKHLLYDYFPIGERFAAYGLAPVTKDMIDLDGFVVADGEQTVRVWIDGERYVTVTITVTVLEAL